MPSQESPYGRTVRSVARLVEGEERAAFCPEFGEEPDTQFIRASGDSSKATIPLWSVAVFCSIICWRERAVSKATLTRSLIASDNSKKLAPLSNGCGASITLKPPAPRHAFRNAGPNPAVAPAK